MHSTRHRSRLLQDKVRRYDTTYDKIRCNLIADQTRKKRKLICYTTPPSAAGFQTAELSVTDSEVFGDGFK